MNVRSRLIVAGFAVAAAATGTAAAFAIAPGTCPKGQQGVVVQNGNSTTSVCTDAHKDVLDNVEIKRPTLPPPPTHWAPR
jgi:hypothetical protein